MKVQAKVGIGITTYLDITGPEFGARVFDAYAAASEAIAPNQVRIWSTKHVVESREDLASLWLTRAPLVVRKNRRRDSEILQRTELLIGAKWRRVGHPAGQGAVSFRPELYPQRDNTICISHNFSQKVDWNILFCRLIKLFEPSYGMMHIFNREDQNISIGDDNFQGLYPPVVGERQFTSWQASTGEWRRPDSFDIEGRRTYRFLPDLAWANFFGPEFNGQYDLAELEAHGGRPSDAPSGFMLRVTDDLRDVLVDQRAFAASRQKLKTAFAEGFFRVR